MGTNVVESAHAIVGISKFQSDNVQASSWWKEQFCSIIDEDLKAENSSVDLGPIKFKRMILNSEVLLENIKLRYAGGFQLPY